MDSAGCNDLATFNADPSPDRLIGAVLCLTAGLLLFVQALIIAGATMLAELSVVGLVVAFPFVIPCGLLPGGARGLLWAWVTRALKAMLVLVATCMTLSLMLVTVSSLITYMSGDPLFEIFIALNAVVIGAIIFRGRITKSLHRMAGSAGQRLAGARIGGTQGRRWLAPAVGGFGAAEVASHLYRARHLANTTRRVAGLRRQLSSGSGTSWPGPGHGPGGGGAGAVAASAGAAAAGAAGGGAAAGGGTARRSGGRRSRCWRCGRCSRWRCPWPQRRRPRPRHLGCAEQASGSCQNSHKDGEEARERGRGRRFGRSHLGVVDGGPGGSQRSTGSP